MKKPLSLILAVILLLGIIGCSPQESSLETYHVATETTGVTENTKPPESTEPATDPKEITQPTEPSEVTESTQSTETTEATEATQPQKPKEKTNKQENESKPTDPPETQPTQPVTEPTDPPSTQPVETQPPETNPPETTPHSTEPPETQPPTEATEPPTEATEPPTEPAGCQHDWKCIHHAEEGHWRAGIVCDCGWTVYGEPGELVAKWNAHSAAYPATESLFDHGGYGSADEWIVDKPAYDEWVCRHCGEAKP